MPSSVVMISPVSWPASSRMAIGMISPALGALDPALETLRHQSADHLVDWMTGIQYYLYEDVPIVRGHVFYPDSPWALTSISQPQFWRSLGLFRRTFGDGEVGGCLSVDISEWDVPGVLLGKPAKQCTRDEIADEVWHQLKAALNSPDEQVLTDELRHSWHLDLDLDLDYSGGLPPVNSSRLLVHPPGSWAIRPEAATASPNIARGFIGASNPTVVRPAPSAVHCLSRLPRHCGAGAVTLVTNPCQNDSRLTQAGRTRG
jgi:uncharacterized protein with NAD-binding domain and iron-sulfur cluster